MRRHVVNLLLLAAVVAVVVVSLVAGSGRSSDGGEKFGGTDAAATEQLSRSGYEPWFAPVFSPESGEVESGLFALQAAIGAGVLGYCVGVLHGRRRDRRPDRDAAERAVEEPRARRVSATSEAATSSVRRHPSDGA